MFLSCPKFKTEIRMCENDSRLCLEIGLISWQCHSLLRWAWMLCQNTFAHFPTAGHTAAAQDCYHHMIWVVVIILTWFFFSSFVWNLPWKHRSAFHKIPNMWVELLYSFKNNLITATVSAKKRTVFKILIIITEGYVPSSPALFCQWVVRAASQTLLERGYLKTHGCATAGNSPAISPWLRLSFC